MQHDFSHITTWVFDLDNTLYPPSDALFDQIDVLMTQYVMQALNLDEASADRLRATYWKDYGTTLAGLMEHHNLAPDPFLEAVHNIDVSHIKKNIRLRDCIAKLKGRKIIYTNGSQGHARNVTRALGIEDIFDAMYGVENANYAPKPHRAAFECIFALDGITPAKAALFEDDARNLEVPHAMGLKTILVGPKEDHPFIHYQTDDLSDFLSRLTP